MHVKTHLDGKRLQNRSLMPSCAYYTTIRRPGAGILCQKPLCEPPTCSETANAEKGQVQHEQQQNENNGYCRSDMRGMQPYGRPRRRCAASWRAWASWRARRPASRRSTREQPPPRRASAGQATWPCGQTAPSSGERTPLGASCEGSSEASWSQAGLGMGSRLLEHDGKRRLLLRRWLLL